MFRLFLKHMYMRSKAREDYLSRYPNMKKVQLLVTTGNRS